MHWQKGVRQQENTTEMDIQKQFHESIYNQEYSNIHSYSRIEWVPF